jgi:pyridoxal phosphate enzyme (YggS family)
VIAERVAVVRERIARAAARAGRLPQDVTLVAVSKTHPPEAVREAFAAGLRDFGENRVQEAEGKIEALHDLRGQGLKWHLVGHLQGNKAKKAVRLFDWIHSLDGVDLGHKLERASAEEVRSTPALVQVDLGHEATKFGLEESQLFDVLTALKALSGLRLVGLMTLPPLEEDPEASRPFFRRLRELRDEALAQGLLVGSELSMGMSHDLEVAVEEGATLVRVGTAVFGQRERA